MANRMEYGFTDLEHLAASRITNELVPEVNNAILGTIAFYNTMVAQELLGKLATRTTAYKTRYYLPDGWEMQPDDDSAGLPEPVTTRGYYDNSYPLWAARIAYGTNEVARAKMTVQEASNLTANVYLADQRWLRKMALSAIFTNVSYTFNDKQYGSLTINPLANGDTDREYLKVDGTTATANHYTAQANAIADGADDPFDDIYALLSSYPGNYGPYKAFVPPALLPAIKALDGWFPVATAGINYGSGVTTVGALSDPNTPGRNNPFAEFGEQYVGMVNENIHIITASWMPANKILTIARGTADTVLAMREDPEPELNGLRARNFDIDSNHELNIFRHRAGFGVQNPVAASVHQVGDSSYDIPTNYDARRWNAA